MLGLRVRGAQLLDAQLGEPLAHVDGRLEGLALHDAGNEAAGECVAGAVGVVDFLVADDVDGDFF